MTPDDLLRALNCPYSRSALVPPEHVCARCGAENRAHAPPGQSIADLGMVHPDHPGWKAVERALRAEGEAKTLGGATENMSRMLLRIRAATALSHYQRTVLVNLRNYLNHLLRDP